MIRCADRWRRSGLEDTMIMWIMKLMMTRVHRMLSLVADNVVLKRPRGNSVRAVGVR